MEKKQITIEVEPVTTIATIGLLRGIFPCIIEQEERQAVTNGSPLKFDKEEAPILLEQTVITAKKCDLMNCIIEES